MTSLSPRKPRTTAPRRRSAGTACKLAAFLALAGGSAVAQYAPPPTGRTAPATAAQPKQSRPQQQTQRTPAPPAAPVSPGQVMYFQKPADALVPVSGSGGEDVAQADEPGRSAVGLPDIPTAPPLPQPAAPPGLLPIPERPIAVLPPPAVSADPWVRPEARPPAGSAAPPAAPPTVVRVVQEKKPDEKKDDKKTDFTKELEKSAADDREARAKYVRIPPLSDVFAFPDDPRLEQAILDRLRYDERMAGRDPYAKYPPTTAFPPEPVLGGGVAYVPKTAAYAPTRVNYNALYVVHRRLHFEEKNAERYGWDLGIVQPLVSAMYFYKDVLLWPNSLASGCAYGFYDTNVGKCMPGSPTPYMLYPPGLTVTGTAFEGVIITGAVFAFP